MHLVCESMYMSTLYAFAIRKIAFDAVRCMLVAESICVRMLILENCIISLSYIYIFDRTAYIIYMYAYIIYYICRCIFPATLCIVLLYARFNLITSIVY